jgi:hypothetical protein
MSRCGPGRGAGSCGPLPRRQPARSGRDQGTGIRRPGQTEEDHDVSRDPRLAAEAIASLHQPVPALQWARTLAPPLELVEVALEASVLPLALPGPWFL